MSALLSSDHNVESVRTMVPTPQEIMYQSHCVVLIALQIKSNHHHLNPLELKLNELDLEESETREPHLKGSFYNWKMNYRRPERLGGDNEKS